MSDQERTWQTGKITTGAYREDQEDVVFDVGSFGWYVSNSHFWNADDRTSGDNSLTYLNSIGHYPNAFTKLNRFQDGQCLAGQTATEEENTQIICISPSYVFRYSYQGTRLYKFFPGQEKYGGGFVNTAGQETFVRDEITATDNVFNAIVWEVLGRMSHLIQDLSVPRMFSMTFMSGGWTEETGYP
ncbi:MAG: hypothetical protein IPM96_22025 [Ignavibacteria bacterium]|nr:hypothetical protein [Ignavibacteria bacterium]